MSSCVRRSWLLWVVWLGLAGCESVPEITFADDPDGSIDARAEASSSDAPIDVADAGAGACTGTPPGGANVCCGTTWCGGSCSQTDCSSCLTTCGAGKFCCLKNGNLMCKTVGSCPP